VAGSKPPLTVIVTPEAAGELWEIWRHNLERYNFEHAESYETFLKIGINRLTKVYDEGKGVDGFPELRSIKLKRSRHGDGHIVIYQVDEVQGTVTVFHIYHTKMDVRGRLESE